MTGLVVSSGRRRDHAWPETTERHDENGHDDG
jgi:hypothetical protein